MADNNPGSGGHLRKIQRLDKRVGVLEGDVLLAFTVDVAKKADLPAAVAGVITLVASTTYNWLQPIDLGTDVLKGNNVTIIGDGSLNASITTNNAAALLSSNGDGFMILEGLRFINTGGPLFAFDFGLAAIDSGLIMFDCSGGAGAKIGTITDASRVSIVGGFWKTFDDGWTFDGEVKELSMHDVSIESSDTGASFKGIEFATTVDFVTVRLSDLRFTTGEATDDALSFHASGTYAQSIKVDNCSHRGLGAFVDSGALQKWAIQFEARGNGEGLADSVSRAEAGFVVGTDETVISTVNVAVRVGTGSVGHNLFVAEFIEDFTLTGAETQLQEYTYIGMLTRTFKIRWDAVVAREGTGLIVAQPAIQKEGTTIPNSEANFGIDAEEGPIFSQTTVSLDTGDTVRIVIANETDDTNFTVVSAKWSAERVG